MGSFVIWGTGPAKPEITRNGEASRFAVEAAKQNGTPIWIATEDLGLIDNELTQSIISILGPYLIGPDGYATVEKAVEIDPDFFGSLDEPESWFDVGGRYIEQLFGIYLLS